MLHLPDLPFSPLWSSTICTPVARITALACVLDIELLCWRMHYRETSLRNPFEIREIFYTFAGHFCDMKLIYNISFIFKTPPPRTPLIPGLCRSWITLEYYEPILLKPRMPEIRKVQIDTLTPQQRGLYLTAEVMMFFWVTFVHISYETRFVVAAFFCAYNFVAVQITWLLKLIFIGRVGMA